MGLRPAAGARRGLTPGLRGVRSVRVLVMAVGRLKAGPERDLAERYRERASTAGRALGFEGPSVVELIESKARRREDRVAEEGERLRERLGATPFVVLDETAPSLSSTAFAGRLGEWRDGGRGATAFLIGGADGLAPALRDAGVASLSFGRLTLPHGLVRVLLLEQLYRAFTIIAGHPYHRDG